MSDFSQDVPSLSTFVRDRLSEHCDALGYDVESVDLPSGERMLYVDRFDCTARIYVDGFALLDADDRHMRPVTLRGFDWRPEPTDTGRVHGPQMPYVCDYGCQSLIRLRGGAYRLYADAMALGIGPVPAGATFGYRDAHDGLRVDTGQVHGPRVIS